MAVWKCRNYNIEYGEKVLMMGIVNVTPDSFSDGGKWFSSEKAVEHALELEMDGADILDIGAQSTRPGHVPVSAEREWERLEDVLPLICEKSSLPVSVDTYYPAVAEKALEAGASIINDVSGVVTPEMAKTVKKWGAGWIIMHSGSGSVAEVKEFFEKSVEECAKLGVDENSVCLDMGIGFGKNYSQDMQLLANVKLYKKDGYPLLLGCSRKRVIGAGSGQEIPAERIYGNIAADTAAVLGGADIIRAHDIKNEKQGVSMALAMKGFKL